MLPGIPKWGKISAAFIWKLAWKQTLSGTEAKTKFSEPNTPFNQPLKPGRREGRKGRAEGQRGFLSFGLGYGGGSWRD